MTNSQKKQEALIKKAVAKYGKEKVIKVLTELGLIEPVGEVSTFGAGDCSSGYYWSESLQRCVLDVGGDNPADPNG